MTELEQITAFINSPVFKTMSEPLQKESLEKQKSLVKALIKEKIAEHITPIIKQYGVNLEVIIKESAEDNVLNTQPEPAPEPTPEPKPEPEPKPTPNPSVGFSVAFPDGTKIHEEKAVDTFTKTLEKIGLRKLAIGDLQIQFASFSLVGTIERKTESGRQWQHRIDDWYIYVYMSNEEKVKTLKKLSDHYKLGLQITWDNEQQVPVEPVQVSEPAENLFQPAKREKLFAKTIDFSLYQGGGTTVPNDTFDHFDEVLHRKVEKGEKIPLKIWLAGEVFKAEYYYVNYKEGTHPKTCQIRWSNNAPIAKKLREVLPDTYEYIIGRRARRTGNGQIHLPQRLKHTCTFYATEEVGTFILETK